MRGSRSPSSRAVLPPRLPPRAITREKSAAGTLFANEAPRLVELFGIRVEAELEGDMIYVVNEDAPGFIGRLGTTLGEERQPRKEARRANPNEDPADDGLP